MTRMIVSHRTYGLLSLLAIALLLITGCADKNSVPSGVLPHDKMEAVMWDVIQSEQYSASYLAKDSAHIDLKLENLRLYDEVFRLHNISRDEFRKSYQYYLGRADLAQILFDSLLAKGNRLRQESYSRPPRPVATTPPVTTPAATTPAKPAASTATPAATLPAKTSGRPPATPGANPSSTIPKLKLSDSSRGLLRLTQPAPDSVRRRRILHMQKTRDSLIRNKINPS